MYSALYDYMFVICDNNKHLLFACVCFVNLVFTKQIYFFKDFLIIPALHCPESRK